MWLLGLDGPQLTDDGLTPPAGLDGATPLPPQPAEPATSTPPAGLGGGLATQETTAVSP